MAVVRTSFQITYQPDDANLVYLIQSSYPALISWTLVLMENKFLLPDWERILFGILLEVETLTEILHQER